MTIQVHVPANTPAGDTVGIMNGFPFAPTGLGPMTPLAGTSNTWQATISGPAGTIAAIPITPTGASRGLRAKEIRGPASWGVLDAAGAHGDRPSSKPDFPAAADSADDPIAVAGGPLLGPPYQPRATGATRRACARTGAEPGARRSSPGSENGGRPCESPTIHWRSARIEPMGFLVDLRG